MRARRGASRFSWCRWTRRGHVQQHTTLSGEVYTFSRQRAGADSMRVGRSAAVADHGRVGRRAGRHGRVAATLLRQLDDLLGYRADPSGCSVLRIRRPGTGGRVGGPAAGVGLGVGSDPGDGGRQGVDLAAHGGVLGGSCRGFRSRRWVPEAALGAEVPGVPGHGVFERALRTSPMFVIGGGTNDIQRAIIARGLGLPREERAVRAKGR